MSIVFGGPGFEWRCDDWVASDDRVRGGASHSYFHPSGNGCHATFSGTLDIKALGGAGFASQRTTGDDRIWDLSNYQGLRIEIKESDHKTYTLVIKDEILAKRSDGREQSTVSWEYDFKPTSTGSATSRSEFVEIPWSSLKPTFRGKEIRDARPLRKDKIRRFSIMMRSFFGQQEGPFSITLDTIAAVKDIGKAVRTDEPRANVPDSVPIKPSSPASCSDLEKNQEEFPRNYIDPTGNGHGNPAMSFSRLSLVLLTVLGTVYFTWDLGELRRSILQMLNRR